MYRFDRAKILPVFLATGWSTFELARRAGTGHHTAHRAINGKPIGAVVLAKIAKALDINPLEYLQPAA